ncbi:hypothetical protein FHP05_03430 [Cerasibacillus terrae]|uniref:Sporulation protein n=1 Tax=Cerasibacillus terrae TaxID=2498845 RepID=A0A5C8P421_9BACI|nr:YhcN/YlaJ family sporulation lipoprotein [Cerasibacillus terrae]TXL68082.1 hypothetical protein FHP05_03430 [Cerasibacillus terrae]
MRIKPILIVVLCFGCIACSPDKDPKVNNETNHSQPMHYETKNEEKNRHGVREKSIGEQGGYPQSKQQEQNRGKEEGPYTDLFTNDESIKIEEHLKGMKEIKQAQVASSDERVVVGVILSNRFEAQSDIAEQIKTSVKEMAPDKTVVVYTDDIHWDRMRNLQSRIKQINIQDEPNLLEKWFE